MLKTTICDNCKIRFKCFTEQEEINESVFPINKKKYKTKTKTLPRLRQKIIEELPYVDLKPYSHNIISLCLREIANKCGRDMANKTIDELGLKYYGWHKEKRTKKTASVRL